MMSQVSGNLKKSINDEHAGKFFTNMSPIKGEGFMLELKETFLYDDANIPGYEFDIKIDNEIAGTFTVLIEPDFTKVADTGNVGIQINQKYFGTQLPARVTRASYPLFKAHRQDSILITCKENSGAIEEACEELSAQFLDQFQTEDGKLKKRYEVKTKGL